MHRFLKNMFFALAMIILRAFEEVESGPTRDTNWNVPGEPLGPEDFIRARHILAAAVSIDEENPAWKSGKFEGDIDLQGLSVEHYVDRVINDSPYHTRGAGVGLNAVRNKRFKWNNARVPYVIAKTFNKSERGIIASAVNEFNKSTCIQWVPRQSSDRDYVFIVRDAGCYSTIGRAGGEQLLSLGLGCVKKGIIIHEMIHATGFWHEQSRADRDTYVTIIWDNIAVWARGQFQKLTLAEIDHLGAKYDYGSVMHYPRNAFSVNGSDTIVPKGDHAIGQTKGFSTIDLFKLNKLYGCDGKATPKPRPKSKKKVTGTTRILISGGKDRRNQPFNRVGILECKHDGHPAVRYTQLPDYMQLKTPRESHKVVVINRTIITIGGYRRADVRTKMDSMEMVNLNKADSRVITPPHMKTGRGEFACGAIDGKIYVCGGFQVKSCECYDVGANEWRTISSMKVSRRAAAGAVLENRFYVSGGNQQLSSVEVYDPETDKWSDVAELNNGRFYHSVASLSGHLYACGGAGTVRRSCERYDPSANRWVAVADMHRGRHGFALIAANGRLYAIGGFLDGSVEFYDPASDKWTLMGNAFDTLMWFAAAAL